MEELYMRKAIVKTIRIFRLLKPAFHKRSLMIPFHCLLCIGVILSDILLPVFAIHTVGRNRPVSTIIFSISLLFLCRFGLGALERFTKRLTQNECRCINHRVECLLSEKLILADYPFLEDKTFLDEKSGATFSVKNYKTIDTLLQGLSTLLCQAVVLVFSGSYLLLSHPLLLALILTGFLLQIMINRKLNKTLDPYFADLFPINRRFRWLSSLKLDISRQKDIRMHKKTELIDKKARQYNDLTCGIFDEMNKITCKSVIKTHFVNTICMYAGYLYNALNMLSGNMSIGAFLSINTLLGELKSTLSSIGDNYTSCEQMLAYLDPVMSLLSRSFPESGTSALDQIETIEFKNVSFQYPADSRPILNNISFKISKGERVALVGLNGAGKTTLVKLLCRFYTPTLGTILINGVDITSFQREQYLSKLSVIFQDFTLFDFSVRENITLNMAYSSDKFLHAIHAADFSLDQSIHRNTMIGPQTNLDGILLSGGQSQRLAMARAIYRDGDVFILDEPDSSVDPLVEYHLYQKYNDITNNRTSLFISHRMITTQFCDKILVLDNGTIAAFLPPSALLQDTDSLYYHLYELQKNQLLSI